LQVRGLCAETPDLRRVNTLAGDFKEDELAYACDTDELVGDIVATWFLRAAGLPTIVYGVNQAHAKHIMCRFLAAGVAAEYIDCFTPLNERDKVFDRFRSGETIIICNVSVADTGVDLPAVGCIIDERPTKSEIRFVQTIGRGLRPAPGKTRLIILDHAGNTVRLGFVTHITKTKLSSAKPHDEGDGEDVVGPPPIKLCPECKTVVPLATRICPECGAEIIPRSKWSSWRVTLLR
jgi:DNA repair protein RadD